MHQCICIFLQVKVYNLQKTKKQKTNKVCIKPTKLQKEFKIIIKCNSFFFVPVLSLYICTMWFRTVPFFSMEVFNVWTIYGAQFLLQGTAWCCRRSCGGTLCGGMFLFVCFCLFVLDYIYIYIFFFFSPVLFYMLVL